MKLAEYPIMLPLLLRESTGNCSGKQFFYGPPASRRVDCADEKYQFRSGPSTDVHDPEQVYLIRWAKRGAQILASFESTVGMVGDLQAIAGKPLPEIPTLDLRSWRIASGRQSHELHDRGLGATFTKAVAEMVLGDGDIEPARDNLDHAEMEAEERSDRHRMLTVAGKKFAFARDIKTSKIEAEDSAIRI